MNTKGMTLREKNLVFLRPENRFFPGQQQEKKKKKNHSRARTLRLVLQGETLSASAFLTLLLGAGFTFAVNSVTMRRGVVTGSVLLGWVAMTVPLGGSHTFLAGRCRSSASLV